ncbi:MAG: hypothetical protein ACXWMJ_11265 [Syntrophales bacterium]
MEKKNDGVVDDVYVSQPVYSLLCLIMAGYSLYLAELSLWVIIPCGIVALVLWFFCEARPIIQERKFKKMCDEMLATVQSVNKKQSETSEFYEALKKVYRVHEQKYWEQLQNLENQSARYHSTLEGLKNLTLAYAYASSTMRLYNPHFNNVEKAQKYISEAKLKIDRLVSNPKYESSTIESLFKKKIASFDRAMAKAKDRAVTPERAESGFATCALCGQYVICPGCQEKRREQDILYARQFN